MGEAKRRKQALGDRYGKTPPVLMSGSEQLSEHSRQFTEAFFEQLKQYPKDLLAILGQKPEEQSESSDRTDPEATQAASKWLIDYLEPYRQQDRAKLASGLLGFLLFRVSAGAQHQEEDNNTEVSKSAVDLTLYIFCLNCLKPFLSDFIREEHEEILQKLYSKLKIEIETDQSTDMEKKTGELEMLTELFHPTLSSETVSI